MPSAATPGGPGFINGFPTKLVRSNKGQHPLMKPSRATRPLRLPKPFAALLGLCVVLGFAGAAAAQDQLRVAVVDVARIFTGYYKVNDFNEKIQEARDAYQRDLDARVEQHHRLVEEVARIEKDLAGPGQDAALKADRQKQRESKVAEIGRQEREANEFRVGRERSIRELTLRVRTQIVEDVMVVVNARIETRHYDLVLNKSGQAAGSRAVLLYASDRLDITDDVLATLNRDRPTAPGAAPGATPP